MKNIGIVGWYGHKNIGDESFRDVFMNHFPDDLLQFSPISNLTSDAIIFGGGGVVCCEYLTKADISTYNKPLYAMGVDIAVNGPEWEQIKKLPFKKLYVRSKEYAKIASVEASNIEYCPDIVFSLHNPTRLAKEGTKTCGFIISHDLKGGMDHLGRLINWLHTDTDVTNIVFILFYTGKPFDLNVTQKVINECKVPYSLIVPSTPEETLQVMSDLDLVVSMRFHGIIFATLLGLPFLALSNKGKCSLFCEQERLFGHHIELSEINDIKLMDRVGWILENKSMIRKRLLDISQQNKLLVDQTFDVVKAKIFKSY